MQNEQKHSSAFLIGESQQKEPGASFEPQWATELKKRDGEVVHRSMAVNIDRSEHIKENRMAASGVSRWGQGGARPPNGFAEMSVGNPCRLSEILRAGKAVYRNEINPFLVCR